MKTQIKNQIQFVLFLTAAVVLTFSWSIARGDDLTPPSYRGDPLSVYAQWNLILGSINLNLTSWNAVDDSDPTTNLYPSFTPDPLIQPSGGVYDLQVPNWVDNMPVKYLRLQLAWVGTTQSPLYIFSQGLDGVNSVLGNITFSSTPQILTSGVYQYFDLEYHPNLDFERIHLALPANNYMTQIVVDTVSTVPEPATICLLGLGGLLLRRKHRA